jgi:hypothetical protein
MALKKDPQSPKAPPARGSRAYERPKILWREPYEPMAFGFSCAKQSANSSCVPPGPGMN